MFYDMLLSSPIRSDQSNISLSMPGHMHWTIDHRCRTGVGSVSTWGITALSGIIPALACGKHQSCWHGRCRHDVYYYLQGPPVSPATISHTWHLFCLLPSLAALTDERAKDGITNQPASSPNRIQRPKGLPGLLPSHVFFALQLGLTPSKTDPQEQLFVRLAPVRPLHTCIHSLLPRRRYRRTASLSKWTSMGRSCRRNSTPSASSSPFHTVPLSS